MILAADATGTVASFLGDVLGGLGSKYTKETFVQRFVAAMQSGDDRTAGTLLDQAIWHAYQARGGLGETDAATWRGLLAACYQQANAKWKNYIELRLSGAPAQYENIGTRVPQPVSIAGVTPQAQPTSPAGSIGQAISNFLGLPQTATQAAQQGGQAAGTAISRGIIAAAVIIGVVVVLVVLLRTIRR